MDNPGGCDGLNMSNNVYPSTSACGENNLEDIFDAMDDTVFTSGMPIGIGYDQLSDIIENGYFTNLGPGQKNFVIHLTDGQETCECEDFQYETGGNSVGIRGGSTGPGVTFTSTTNASKRTYNAGLKAEESLRQIDPDLDGSKGNIFLVGMGLEDDRKERANHIAWLGSGARIAGRDPSLTFPAFFGDDPDELLAVLTEILGIISTPDTEVSLGQSVVGSVKELIPLADSTITSDDILAARIAGALDEDDTEEAREIRGLHPSNILFSTSVVTPEWEGHLKAFNIYKVVDKGTEDERRVADYTQIWDAGEKLRDVDPDDRTVLFNRLGDGPGSFPMSFEVGNVLATALNVAAGFLAELDGTGATTAADAAEIIVRVIRGERLSLHPVNGLYQDAGRTILNFSKFEADGTTPTWKLYDPTNAGPTVVQNPPRPPSPLYHAQEYGSDFDVGFFWEHINRTTVVYLGTNGGPMHAFRAENGAELYAYVPGDVLPKLESFVRLVVSQRNGYLNHEFMVASAATAEDAFFQTDQYRHTILAFGRGPGGKYLTALDISGAPDWDGTTTNETPIDEADLTHLPRLRFTVGNAEASVDLDGQGENYDGLGETWSVPVMGMVAQGTGDQAVLFSGSGYGCDGTDQGMYFYVLNLEDGTVHRKFGPIGDDPQAAVDDNRLVATPTLFWHEDLVTRVYVGDLQGRVHKMDTSDSYKAQWTFNEFYELGDDQPISATIATFVNGSSQVQLFVGTGGDTRVSLASGEYFKLVGLIDGDIEGQNTPGAPMTTTSGAFEVDLPQDERIFVAPVTVPTPNRNGAVFFASSAPIVDPVTCLNIFTSTLFGFGATTGTVDFDLDQSQSGTQSSTHVGDTKVTGLLSSRGASLHQQERGSQRDRKYRDSRQRRVPEDLGWGVRWGMP